MPTLLEILNDPNYVNANQATKEAIFNKYAGQDENYTGANEATQSAIRQKFGIGQVEEAPAEPTTAEAPATEEKGIFAQALSNIQSSMQPSKEGPIYGGALDVPLNIGKGAVQGVRMIADAFGANSGVSSTLRGAENYIGGLMSAYAKNDAKEVSRIMKEAEDKGALEQVKAAFKAMSVAPVDLVTQALGTAAPAIVGALGAELFGLGALAMTGLGALTGAGVVKGTIYETVKEELIRAGEPPDIAEKKAEEAQSYGGKNLDMILGGTALGVIAGRTGIERFIAGKIATKEAAKEAAEQGIAKKAIIGGVEEAAPEFLQASQEQLAANVALQRQGFDIPTLRGVVGAGTLEALAGFGLGAPIKVATDAGVKEVSPRDELIEKLQADLDLDPEEVAVLENAEDDAFIDQVNRLAQIAAAEAQAAREEESEPMFGRQMSTEEFYDMRSQVAQKFGREPTTTELEGLVNEFERNPDATIESIVGGIEPSVSMPAGRIEPTTGTLPPVGAGLGSDSDLFAGTTEGAGQGDVAVKPGSPESTMVYSNIGRPTGATQQGNVALQNYFKTYYGLPAKSLPKAASVLMPLLQRAETLLQAHRQAFQQSNMPFLDVGPGERYKRNANRPPEYVEAYRYMPSGEIRRLANTALAIDKNYQTKGNNPKKFAGEIADFEEQLNKFEEAINNLPPPLTDEERQVREADYEAKQTPVVSEVPKAKQLQALANLLRKGTYTPAMVDPARLQEAIDAGLITPEEITNLQKQPAQVTPSVEGEPTMAGMQAELDRLRAEGATLPTFSPPSKIQEKKAAKEKKALQKSLKLEEQKPRFGLFDRDKKQVRAKPSVNMKRMAQLLGPQLYGSKSEIQAVSVKEMLQNSFDAIKDAMAKAGLETGRIKISINSDARTVTMSDNGIGMSPELLGGKFLQIAGTGKSDHDIASGGFGIAKMLFLFGNEEVIVHTVKDGVASDMRTGGEELFQAMEDPDFEPVINVYDTDEPNGTTITVKIPEAFVDPSTGEEEKIRFRSHAAYFNSLMYSPLFADIEVTLDSGYGPQPVPIGSYFPYDDFTQFANVNFKWGTARIYITKKPTGETYGENLHVLSRGLWQFSSRLKVDPPFGDNIPYTFYLDVDPKVRPDQEGYPFDLARQKFSPNTKEDFDKIFNYITALYRQVDFANQVKDFGTYQYLKADENGDVSSTEAEKVQPIAPPSSTAANVIKEGDTITVKDGKLVVNGRAIPELTREDLKNTALNIDELKMDQAGINPDLVMLHDNVQDPDGTPLVEAAIERFGEQEVYKFLNGVGGIFQELRDLVASMDGYSELAKEAVGISFDKEYRGVSIKVPFEGMFINPAVPEFTDPVRAGIGVYGTMIHELAHFKERSHNARFPAEMQRLMIQLSADVGLDQVQFFQNRLVDLYDENKVLFDYLNGVVLNENSKPIGNRFKDASEAISETRDGGPIEHMVELGPRAGSSDVLSESDGGGDPNVEQERVGAGVSSEIQARARAKEIGLDEGLVDAILRNDLNGALRIIAGNRSGFFSSLAEKLASVNLPTAVGIGREAMLTMNHLEYTVGKQMTSLFAYVQMANPDFYAKYFDRYDKEENLKRVHEGLKKLEGSNIDLNPVIGQYEDVSKQFNSVLPALRMPGAFFPIADAFTVSLERLKSRNEFDQVFLHEITHAATEHLLSLDEMLLSDKQREAKRELEKLYAVAQDKLNEDPNASRWFENIYEFVAYSFSSPALQAKLKQIKYEPKQTLWTKFVREVADLFGMDNLLGNTLAVASNLFSSEREGTYIGAKPVLFARQNRSLFDQKYKFRTAYEDPGVFKRILTGRATMDEVTDGLGAVVDSVGDRTRGTMLGFLQNRMLADLTKKRVPLIGSLVNLVDRMSAYRYGIMEKAAEIIKPWAEFQRKNESESRLLNKVMLEATLRGKDPAKADAKNRADRRLNAAYDALSPEAKKIYQQVRDFYAKQLQATVVDLKLRVRRSDATPEKKRELIRKIDEQFGKDKLTQPYFPLRRFGKFWFEVQGDSDNREFYMFESAKERNYWMRRRKRELAAAKDNRPVVPGNEISKLNTALMGQSNLIDEVKKVVSAATAGAQTIAEAQAGIDESINQLIYLMLPERSMRKMFINRKGIQGASADGLRVFAESAVKVAYQRARFRYTDQYYSGLLAARQYVEKMLPSERKKYMTYVYEFEQKAPEILAPDNSGVIAQVMGQVSNASFLYYLSSPASALMQVGGFLQVGAANMTAVYGSTRTAAKIIPYLFKYIATTPKQAMKLEFPTLDSAGLSPLARKFYDRLLADNRLNVSLAHDIVNIGEQPSATYTGRTKRVMQILTALFHNAERMTREVMNISAAELAHEDILKRRDVEDAARNSGKTEYVFEGKKYDVRKDRQTDDQVFEEALQSGVDLTFMSLGDFSKSNKGRFFTGPVASVITQFKQYPLLMTYIILRNGYLAVPTKLSAKERDLIIQEHVANNDDPNQTPQQKQQVAEHEADLISFNMKADAKEARRKLAWIMGATALFAGATGLPFFTVTMKLIEMVAGFLDDDDEKNEFFNAENWFKNYTEEKLGGFWGGAVSRGLIPQVTGASLADRMSLDLVDMWFRDTKYSADPKETVQQIFIGQLGPAAGLALETIPEAVKLFEEGQHYRAVEKLVPAMVREWLKAYRFSDEGVKTPGGNTTLARKELTNSEITLQALGLQPEKLAQRQKANIEAKKNEQKIKDKRQAIYNQFNFAVANGDLELQKKVIEDLIKFNKTYPNYAIEEEQLVSSVEKTLERKAYADSLGGVYIEPKLLPYIEKMLKYGK